MAVNPELKRAFDGIFEARFLKNMRYEAQLLRDRYSRHVRYAAHKSQLRAIGMDISIGSSQIPENISDSIVKEQENTFVLPKRPGKPRINTRAQALVSRP
jgi:hypothetical protein